MPTNVEKYLAKKKSEPKIDREEIKTPERSPYVEPLMAQIIEQMVGKIKQLKGEDGRSMTEEEIMAVLNPHIERTKKEIGKEFTKEKLLKMISSMIPKLEDGKTPQKGKDYFTKEEAEEFLKLSTPIKGKHYFDGRRGRAGRDAVLPSLYKLAINTINVIESLEGEDRIDAKAIKNLKKLIREIVSQETIGFNYGGPGNIIHDNTLIGNGVSIPLGVNPSGGSGANFETPSGIIDSSNVTFTVLNTPKAIILNGVVYFENDGYTRVGLTITMLVVPMTGSTLRSMF